MEKDIYKDMREVMIGEIMDHIRQKFYDKLSAGIVTEEIRDEAYKHHKLAETCLPHATIPQLWRLTRYCQQGTDFKILHCTPNDHMGITFAGMYVGIELDGYAHS